MRLIGTSDVKLIKTSVMKLGNQVYRDTRCKSERTPCAKLETSGVNLKEH